MLKKEKTCKHCKNYKKTQLTGYDLQPYLGKGMSLDEIIEKCKEDPPIPIYDCPYCSDWCEADMPINTYCDNKFEKKGFL